MIADLESFLASGNPSEAERKLIDCWRKGRACVLNGGNLPETEEAQQAAHVRGPLLAFLLRSPDLKPGFGLKGASVQGSLKLEYCRIDYPIILQACHFSQRPSLAGAVLRVVMISDCRLPGLFAENLTVSETAQFRGTHFSDRCYLHSARIGGQLSFDEVRFESENEDCLVLQQAVIGRSLFLNQIRSRGTLDLSAVAVGKQCSITCANLDSGTSDVALQLQEARFESTLVWRDLQAVKGKVEFRLARAQILADDIETWKLCQDGIDLEGFSYTSIPSERIGDLSARLAWLAAGCRKSGFSPQPYTMLAAVLRDNGDDAAARVVLMERERRYIAHEAGRMWARIRSKWRGAPEAPKRTARQWASDKIAAMGLMLSYGVHRIWGGLKRLVIGYGYDPKRPLYWSVALIALGAGLAHLGWEAGVFTPSSDQILTSGDWIAAVARDAISPTAYWLNTPSALHYEEFSPFLFALDTYLPVMDLGQESAWAVTTVTTTGTIGRALWIALQAAGWIVTSLGIAAVAGLVQKGRSD